MRRKRLVQLTIGISLIVSVLCISGFVISIKEILYKNHGEAKVTIKTDNKTEEKKFTIVGLGDSLTRGIGDEDGSGYFGIFKKQFSLKSKQPTSFVNLAVTGAKSKDLISLLKENGTQYTLKKADMIVMTMGGNDVFPGWKGLNTINATTYTGNIKQFEKDVQTILQSIRTINPTASIYWLSLYNPFEDIQQLKGASSVTSAWNGILQQVAYRFDNVYVIPTSDIFQGQTKSFLYSDHFHPNNAGYTQMAGRLLQKVESQYK